GSGEQIAQRGGQNERQPPLGGIGAAGVTRAGRRNPGSPAVIYPHYTTRWGQGRPDGRRGLPPGRQAALDRATASSRTASTARLTRRRAASAVTPSSSPTSR